MDATHINIESLALANSFIHAVVHYSGTYFEGNGEKLNGKLLILSQNISVCVHTYSIADIQSGSCLMIKFIIN